MLNYGLHTSEIIFVILAARKEILKVDYHQITIYVHGTSSNNLIEIMYQFLEILLTDRQREKQKNKPCKNITSTVEVKKKSAVRI